MSAGFGDGFTAGDGAFSFSAMSARIGVVIVAIRCGRCPIMRAPLGGPDGSFLNIRGFWPGYGTISTAASQKLLSN